MSEKQTSLTSITSEESIYERVRADANLSDRFRNALSSSSESELDSFLTANGFVPLEPRSGDPLARLLFSGNWLHLIFAEFGAIALFALSLVAAKIFHNFTNPSLALDALRDVGYWNHALATCALILTMGLYQSELRRVLLELGFLGVCKAKISAFNNFVKESNTIYRNRWLTWTPYLISLIITVVGIYVFHLEVDPKKNYWHGYMGSWQTRVSGLLQLPFCFLTYYVAAYTIFRIGATFVVLKKYFALDTNIDPLHADGCGGLYSLGRLSMRLNAVVFVFGFIVALGFTVNKDYGLGYLHPMNILLITTYISSCVVIFFLPLYAARSRMYDARLKAMMASIKSFEHVRRDIQRALFDGKGLTEHQHEALRRSQDLHKMIVSMPVYPFNTRIISSFLGSLVAPLILFLIERFFK
jgi:hypothetical protein